MLNHFSHVQLLVTLWTVARQAPRSMGFSRKEYWSGLPCPPPGDLLNRGIKAVSLISALAEGFFTNSATWEVQRLTLPEIISFPSLSHFPMHFLVNMLALKSLSQSYPNQAKTAKEDSRFGSRTPSSAGYHLLIPLEASSPPVISYLGMPKPTPDFPWGQKSPPGICSSSAFPLMMSPSMDDHVPDP